MAVDVGVRPAICTIDVPRRMRDVCDPYQASGLKASEPHDSAVNTVSKPSFSASSIFSRASVGGWAIQYPRVRPSFIDVLQSTGHQVRCLRYPRTRSDFFAYCSGRAVSDTLWEQLQQFVGKSNGEPGEARDPVNVPMIRHLTDALEDRNPVYTDEEAALASVHGGLVAPATSLQVWTMTGLVPGGRRRGSGVGPDPMAMVDAAGYVGVVATNCDQTYHRYLRPGDVLTVSSTLESISPLKKTALGEGYFFTTLQTYTDQKGEVVGRCASASSSSSPPPRSHRQDASQDAADRTAADRLGVLLGGRRGRRAAHPAVRRVRHVAPPAPAHVPQLPLARARLRRVVGQRHRLQLRGAPPPAGAGQADAVHGRRGRARRRHTRRRQRHRHRPVGGHRRPAGRGGVRGERGGAPAPAVEARPMSTSLAKTLRFDEVAVGQQLPELVLELTPTMIVSTAIATRDYQDVHHDRDLAQQKGSKDIFMNILTTNGYRGPVRDRLGRARGAAAQRVDPAGRPQLPLRHHDVDRVGDGQGRRRR